uniref:Uncharacterized protein n=1 Tax=Spongospora subterranea TaxID=70186 RepID=A0A0H5RUL2_9EUKA|eukprot:CRZ12424.1 hypothetical protein [Spongospora subterranea]
MTTCPQPVTSSTTTTHHCRPVTGQLHAGDAVEISGMAMDELSQCWLTRGGRSVFSEQRVNSLQLVLNQTSLNRPTWPKPRAERGLARLCGPYWVGQCCKRFNLSTLLHFDVWSLYDQGRQ